MDEDERAMEVIVPDDQLSLAIGKKGQNVRLASRLTGWRLDVRGEAEAEEEARNARASLMSVPGIGDVTAELLYQHGFKSSEELATSDVDTVAQVDGVSPEKAATIIASAQKHVEQKRIEAEARAVVEAAAAEAAAAAAVEAAATATAEAEAAATAEAAAAGEDRPAEAVEGGSSEEGGA
jgi:N utilization substance protein A